jgi:hypothetical protein
MTLNTSVAIGAPTDVREVYAFCRKLLDTPEDVQPQESEDGHQRCIRNPGGIGLAAWLWINYGADGPLRHECESWCDEDCDDAAGDRPTDNGWAAIEVQFDTAYGYRGADGESCSDLHARLVTALGRWLDRKGLPWKWQNEYTGEWFNRFDQLDAFGDAHRSTGADDWFRNVVLPAIVSAGGGPE